MKIMLNIFALALFVIPFSNLLATENLNCSTTDYSRLSHNYNKKWMQTWLPEKFEVSIDGDNAFLAYRKGKVISNDNSRIAISHKHYFNKSQPYSIIKFIYFKTTSKFTASVIMPSGYLPSGSIWGKCEYTISSNDNNTSNKIAKKGDLNSNLKQKEIVDGEFKLVRSSSSTDLFYNIKNSTVLVKSNSKYYNKLHKRLLDDPDTDIRIGFFWDEEKKKAKKYMFQYKKPNQIFVKKDGIIREMYIKDNSINIITEDLKKYLYVSITDYNKGMWVATRTEKSEN
jgi:hypothetical protein